MADYIHYITWYTVYSAKTGEVVAAGTSAMCAAKFGYKTANSFVSSVGHRRHEKKRPHKYIFEQERIDRAEVDCLPPLRRYCKKVKREQEYEQRFAGMIVSRSGCGTSIGMKLKNSRLHSAAMLTIKGILADAINWFLPVSTPCYQVCRLSIGRTKTGRFMTISTSWILRAARFTGDDTHESDVSPQSPHQRPFQ